MRTRTCDGSTCASVAGDIDDSRTAVLNGMEAQPAIPDTANNKPTATARMIIPKLLMRPAQTSKRPFPPQ